jgi:hypothetical protein
MQLQICGLVFVLLETKVPFIWTSGRLCDFAGCEREEFFPKNINGWFWTANQVPILRMTAAIRVTKGSML